MSDEHEQDDILESKARIGVLKAATQKYCESAHTPEDRAAFEKACSKYLNGDYL